MPLAIILDMDGLLLDTEPISLGAWRHAAAQFGYDLDDEVSGLMIGLSAAANRAMLLEHFGAGLPIDALCEMAETRYRKALGEGGILHKPGLVSFFRFLDERRLPRAVATSTAINPALRTLRQAGILQYLDTVVGGDQVSLGKPAPDIFLKAAERLGHSPEHCVVLEDSGPGIQAAAAAGMRPILIPDVREPSAEIRQASYAVVDSLTGAAAIIDQILNLRGTPESQRRPAGLVTPDSETA